MRSLNPWPIFPSNLDPPVARSLSIQFILQAVLDCFPLLQDLRKNTPHHLKNFPLQDAILAISRELEDFLRLSLENPFAQKGSVLDKLCFYSEILLQSSHVKESEVPNLLEEMRNLILKTKSKMIVCRKTVEEVQTQFMELYDHLFEKLCSFFDAFAPFLKEARYDENVLIYLIENKDRFNTYVGARKIEDLLQSFFPAGHSQLRAAILEGFTRRGFTTFLASVEPLIDAIEWDTPCQTLF